MRNRLSRYADQAIALWIAAALAASIIYPGSVAHKLLGLIALIWLAAVGAWVIITTANGKGME